MTQSWSAVKKQMEQDLLCEALRGRIQYFHTRYHAAHDSAGRFSIQLDGQEIFRANPYVGVKVDQIANQLKRDQQIPPRQWNDGAFLYDEENARAEAEAANRATEKGIFEYNAVLMALEEYRSLPIGEALCAENLLIRMFAILDRRVGKRTLQKLKQETSALPEWLVRFYTLRFEAERARE